MAKQTAAWGIDIGHCSLKALRCVPSPDGDGVVAEAFDFIEYPKILTQPDAEPDVLVREALEQFLSRNELRGDKVAISVSGQAGLSRFFQPPPVDAKTLPEIVKYEARQQIPFQLDDVIWDFQQIGGTEVDGLIMDAEVGIFAMKRDAVFKNLAPFTEKEIEVDIIQLAPLSLYNVVNHELLHDLPPADEIDPSNPPESLVVISMGTDTTDLVITDGFKLWQRNIPIGGNHFTKQLARELKLTYAKAEHLKRNARKAEDPKTIFQAMRPVFNDLVTELQRSLSYFQGVHKKARLGRVLIFGNASKLPGLRQFLSTSLSTEIGKINGYERLGGSSVTSSKQFEENNLSYAVCYGLCLQALNSARLKTNLLPREFITERIIRAKKPWALAGVGALLLGCSINYFFNYMGLANVHPDKEIAGETWDSATTRAKEVATRVSDFKEEDKKRVTELEKIRQVQAEIAGSIDGRLLWPELYSAICQAMPVDPRIQPGVPVDPKTIPYAGRQQIYIDSIETVFEADLKKWLTADVKKRYIEFVDFERRGVLALSEPAAAEDEATSTEGAAENGAEAPADAAAPQTPADGNAAAPNNAAPNNAAPAAGAQGQAEEKEKTLDEIEKAMKLEGAGWVIQIKGHHYFNDEVAQRSGTGGGIYVRNTLLRALEHDRVNLPIPADMQSEFAVNQATLGFTFSQLGVRYPVLTQDPRPNYAFTIANPDHPSYSSGTGGGVGAGSSGVMGMMSGGGIGGSGPGGGGAAGSGTAGSTNTSTAEATDEPLSFDAPRYEFTIQFAWQPVTLRERLQLRAAKIAERERANRNNAGGNNAGAVADEIDGGVSQ